MDDRGRLLLPQSEEGELEVAQRASALDVLDVVPRLERKAFQEHEQSTFRKDCGQVRDCTQKLIKVRGDFFLPHYVALD